MALFKISKGLSTNLMTNVPNAKEGFAYFTTDDGKFYIDIDGDGSNNTPAVIGNNRIPLNAYTSDILKATSMGTNDNVVYPLLTFKVKDSTKNLIEAKYGAIGIKNGTLVIPNVNNNDEILISNTGAGRGIVIDNTNGTGHAIEITAGKGIKVAKDPVDNLELATKQYVDKILSANDAMIFKGILDGEHPLPTTGYEVGHTYRVNAAGTYAGQKCEQGDLIICIADASSTSTPHWTVAQTNIDGAVIGPNTSTANAVSTFADATGKVIKDNPAVTIDDTGLFTAPYIATGTNETNYFQSKKFRGEGNANTYYHAVDFGYAGHDQVDFHEYGGTWNFYKNTKGTVDGGQLVVSIKPDGFHGNLKGNADTATTATAATKITQTVRDAEEGNYPLLLANNGQTATTTGATYFDKSVTLNPKTNTIAANISGKANTSGTADEVANNLTIQLNNGTTEGTNKFTYNGSAVKNINITSSSIGAASSSHNHDSSYVKKSGDTMTGLLKTNGSIENQGEAKFTHPTYCPEVEDTAENIGCAFKASRGHFNQMNVNEIYLPATTTTNYEGNKISFKTYSGGNNGTYTNVSEVAQINTTGLKVGSSSIGTNGYIEGTWLKTTANISSDKVGNFAIVRDGGWIYSRTPAQARQDMGLSTAMHFIGKATVDVTDGSTVDPKITGYTTKTAGDVIIDKSNSYEYVWTLEGKWERLGPDGSYSVVGHTHDSSYVKKSGDTMTGDLTAPTFHGELDGNADTATKFKDAQSITLTGDVTGTASSQAGWSIATTLSNSGVTNGTYGPTGNVNGTNGATISIPQITVDAKGRVTSIVNRTYTSVNTDTNTTYSAGTGLSLSGTTINHSNSITAGSVGTAQSPSHGGTFAIPKITYDAQGHITGATTVNITLPADNNTDTKVTTAAQTSSKIYVTGTPSTGTVTGTLEYNENVYISGNVMYGACWNDYAEYRISDCQESGRVICENGDDTLSLATERLQPAGNVISDTFGFVIGETEQAKTPVAVSGRVLAYPYESREEFKKNIGRPVCSGPNGTVSIMTDKEYRDKGYCAIGTISAVPDYEEWGAGKIKVNGRVWIKVS